jgi:hypothetical protein
MKGINKMKVIYSETKAKKVGENCVCPSCDTEFIKTHYAQGFCKSKGGTYCKDYYWNNVTPSKRNNTTRISPASQRWLNKQSRERSERFIYSEHPFSSEALGQW